jgi:chorismate dehydratase
LFEHVWRAQPQFLPGDAELSDLGQVDRDPHDARLVIGDAALLLTASRGAIGGASYPYAYDLGAEWKAWTGLPFVFAVWVAQRASARAQALTACAALRASRDWGLDHLPDLARQAADVTGVANETCLEYLSGLDYGLSYAHLAGLTEFFRRLVVAGRVPDGSLAFLPAA